MKEIWILGATGRSGRAVAQKLANAPQALVLVGRDTARLQALAAEIGGNPRIVTAASLDAIISELSRSNPAVVINTIGPFSDTAVPIARACPDGTHYVDISNELPSFLALLAMHDEALRSGRTFVSGAGFGVLASEGLVLKLCEGQPRAAKVRVDIVPMVITTKPDRLGDALAATIIDSFISGGKRYADGQLERTGLVSDVETLKLRDGTLVKTAGIPTGDLEAARRASGASFVVAANSMAPTSQMLGMILTAAVLTLRIPTIGNFAKRKLAAVEMKPKKLGETKDRQYSWTHAKVEWHSGACREGWLRTGDAMEFTVNTLSEVAIRLARDKGRPGSYTPGALFGPELALAAGGEFLLD